jgi:hypothetical protein
MAASHRSEAEEATNSVRQPGHNGPGSHNRSSNCVLDSKRDAHPSSHSGFMNRSPPFLKMWSNVLISDPARCLAHLALEQLGTP